MTSRRNYLLAALIGSATALFGTQAHAGFNSYSVQVSTNGLSLTNSTTPLALPGFNASLGGLESVVITASDAAQVSALLTNKSAKGATFTISDSIAFALNYGSDQMISDSVNISRTYNLATGQSTMFGVYKLAGAAKPVTIIDPNLLSIFTSAANIDFSFTANAVVTTSGQGGNVVVNPLSVAGTDITITYNYFTPNFVPEPSSVAMSALGGLLVAGAGYVRRRRAAVPR